MHRTCDEVNQHLFQSPKRGVSFSEKPEKCADVAPALGTEDAPTSRRL